MGKVREATRFARARVRDMKTNRPFVVPDTGYYVWVVPPFIAGKDNEEDKKRVLCSIETEKNGTLRLCARFLNDQSLANRLDWQEAIALHELKIAFGTSTNKPEFYIDQVEDGESGGLRPVKYSLKEEPKEAEKKMGAGHL